jgi:hypothetical protein
LGIMVCGAAPAAPDEAPRAPGGRASPRGARAGGTRAGRASSSGWTRSRPGDRPRVNTRISPRSSVDRVAFGPGRPSRRGSRGDELPAGRVEARGRRPPRTSTPSSRPPLPPRTCCEERRDQPAGGRRPDGTKAIRSCRTASWRRSAPSHPRARRPGMAPTSGAAASATGRRAAGPASLAGAWPRWSPPWGRRGRHDRP